MENQLAPTPEEIKETRKPLFRFDLQGGELNFVREREEGYSNGSCIAVSGDMSWTMPSGLAIRSTASGENTVQFEHDKRTWIITRRSGIQLYKRESERRIIGFHQTITLSESRMKERIVKLETEIERLNKCIEFVVAQLPEKKRLDYIHKRDQFDGEQIPF